MRSRNLLVVAAWALVIALLIFAQWLMAQPLRPACGSPHAYSVGKALNAERRAAG